jgi:SIR2-like domain
MTSESTVSKGPPNATEVKRPRRRRQRNAAAIPTPSTAAEGNVNLVAVAVPRNEKSPPSPVRLDDLFPAYSATNYDAQAVTRRTQLVEEVRQAYLGDGLALYIGAGVSMSLGLPSWNELINSLTIAMMSRRVTSAAHTLQTLTDEERAAALQALLDAVKEQKPTQKPILMMARALKDQFGDELPQLVAAHLYGRLSPTTGAFFTWVKRFFSSNTPRQPASDSFNLPTSPLLESLVALIRPQRNVVGVQAIINYNYDDILEERLRQDSVPCITMLSGKQKLTKGKIPAYHVHGALPVRQYFDATNKSKKIDNGNFVFSEDEYHSEYADPYRWSNLTQISMLGRHRGLFVGLSMQDPNLRRLIDVTHRQYPEIWNYAVLQRPPRLPTDDSKSIILGNLAEFVEEDSFLKIGVKVIWVDNIRTDVAPLLQQVSKLPDD